MKKKKTTNSDYYNLAQTSLFRKLISLEEENTMLRQENSKLIDHIFKLQNKLDSQNKSLNNIITNVKYCFLQLKGSESPDSVKTVLKIIRDILFLYDGKPL